MEEFIRGIRRSSELAADLLSHSQTSKHYDNTCERYRLEFRKKPQDHSPGSEDEVFVPDRIQTRRSFVSHRW